MKYLKFVNQGLTTTLHNINNFLVSDEYKLKAYTQYVLPAGCLTLTVHNITKTNLVTLDALSDKYIKRWLLMAQSETLAVVHANMEGLSIKSFSHIYKESHELSHATSRLKADRELNIAFSSYVAHEEKWIHKSSFTSYSEDHFSHVIPEIPPHPCR